MRLFPEFVMIIRRTRATEELLHEYYGGQGYGMHNDDPLTPLHVSATIPSLSTYLHSRRSEVIKVWLVSSDSQSGYQARAATRGSRLSSLSIGKALSQQRGRLMLDEDVSERATGERSHPLDCALGLVSIHWPRECRNKFRPSPFIANPRCSRFWPHIVFKDPAAAESFGHMAFSRWLLRTAPLRPVKWCCSLTNNQMV
nr:hypothetical protein CFP56_52754 [Quercus suber]